MVDAAYAVLDKLRLPNGLYIASESKHYQHVWIRDSVYMCISYLDYDNDKFKLTMHRLLDLFKQHEWKIDCVKRKKPEYEWEYLHARYDLDGQEIITELWGHAQNDMIGLFLFVMSKGMEKVPDLIRDDSDLHILKRLVEYLSLVEYWHDEDNGMWEENREVHSSSVGACLAGLIEMKKYFDVSADLISRGSIALDLLLPNESLTRDCDLSQLSLIYPYNIVDNHHARLILGNNGNKLVRNNGVIRYVGDRYYSFNQKEAEWTFGFPWLSLCYGQIGEHEKAINYLHKSEELMLSPGVFPESYYGGTKEPNPHIPLGWSSSMYILAKKNINIT